MICGSEEVFRSSIIIFFQALLCVIYMLCSDKVTGTQGHDNVVHACWESHLLLGTL